MIAFSQGPLNSVEDLYLGEERYGFANNTSSFYRHFLTDTEATLVITCTSIEGDPILMAKVKSSTIRPDSSQPETYDFKNDETNVISKTITYDFDRRFSENPDCIDAAYQLNGGNTLCGLYIGVECKTSQCAYQINVQIESLSTDENIQFPRYINTDGDYYDGKVAYGDS